MHPATDEPARQPPPTNGNSPATARTNPAPSARANQAPAARTNAAPTDRANQAPVVRANPPAAADGPQWPDWARAEAPPEREPLNWQRFAMPLLIVVLVVQAALLAWTWLARAPVFEADSAPLVIVTSDPSGAPVVVDGLPRGQTPLRIVLDAGKHQLQVGPDGSASTQWMDVAPGAFSTLHVVQASGPAASAEREGGVLEITTEPAGLSVQVDGTPRGISPIAISDLAPGVHEVTVMRGTRRVTRAVSVDAGVPTAVLISTVGEAGVPSGWLTVTGPVPLQILEDGTLVGSTDSPRLLLPTGRHQLDFVNDTFGYRERRAVDIVPGQTAAVAMAAATGTLSVNAQPWGEVWIDGTHVGETPIGNLSLPIGNHELVVRHPQLGEQRRTIPIRVNTPSRVGVDLRQ